MPHLCDRFSPFEASDAMRFAIVLVLAALYLCAPAAWAEEYHCSGNVVAGVDGI